MADMNAMLNQMSASMPCPDLLDLQQSVAEIAVLEQELLDYVGRLRVHQVRVRATVWRRTH